MTLTGGKRKVNKSLKSWVKFVKKVQKEEKLSYKEAIHRAKIRKDKGEKWMTGGEGEPMHEEVDVDIGDMDNNMDVQVDKNDDVMAGGRRRRRRTMRRSRSRRGGKRSRSRSRSRRHRRRH